MSTAEVPEAPKPPKQSIATVLVELALSAGVKLFHDADGEPFATVPVEDHTETWHVRRGGGLRRWLRQAYFCDTGRTPSSNAIDDALGTLEGIACCTGPCHPVHLRVAATEGHLYLDLADPEWRVIDVTPTGWTVQDTAPVHFRRTPGMLPLPVPVSGGHLDDLRNLLPLDDHGWHLVAGWLVGTLYPDHPFPILAVAGDPGAAKTTLARMLRRFVDPNKADLRPCPRDEVDLILAAQNGWVVAFDNVSGLKPWLSDGLCRVATGIGFGRRQLYTDGDEFLVMVQRPIVINGIEDVATRGDFADRAIVHTMQKISDEKRRDDAEVWAAFAAAHPALLGALLDVVASALGRVADVQIARKPRMADFARWVTAAEPALGWAPGAFLRSYRQNRGRAAGTVLEGSPIVEPLRVLLGKTPVLDCTVGALLTKLRDCLQGPATRVPSSPPIRSACPGNCAGSLPRCAGWASPSGCSRSGRSWDAASSSRPGRKRRGRHRHQRHQRHPHRHRHRHHRHRHRHQRRPAKQRQSRKVTMVTTVTMIHLPFLLWAPPRTTGTCGGAPGVGARPGSIAATTGCVAAVTRRSRARPASPGPRGDDILMLDGLPTLNDIARVPEADVPALVGHLAMLVAAALLRRPGPPPPVLDDVVDCKQAAALIGRSESWLRKHGRTVPGFVQATGRGGRVGWQRRALLSWSGRVD